MVFRYFIGNLVNPGGFGFSRWMNGFIDYTGLPVLFPLLFCVLFVFLKIFPAGMNYCGFTLLYLIPVSAFRSIGWSSPGYFHLLVLTPLLWTVQAVGISFFGVLLARHLRRYFVAACLGLGIAVLPVIAGTCWWAFYCQQGLLGFLMLFAALIPAVLAIILDFYTCPAEPRTF